MTLHKTLYYGIIGLLGLVLAIPFLVTNDLFFPYITGKNLAFRTIVQIIFVAYIFLAALDPAYRPKRSWLLIALGVFIGSIGLANIFAEDMFKAFWSNYERMEGYVSVLHLGAFTFVIAHMLKTKLEWLRYSLVSLGIAAVLVFYGYIELFRELAASGNMPRIDATLGNPTYFAAYILFHIGLLVYIGITDRARAKPAVSVYVYGLGIAFFVGALFFTGTRGTMLGLIGGSFAAALLIVIFGKQYTRLRKAALIALASIGVLVGAFILLKDTALIQNVVFLRRFAEITFTTNPYQQARPALWGMAVQGIQERPLVGWGQDNFNYVFAKYYNPQIYGHEQWFDRSHNMFVEWLVTTGIVGFTGYILLLVAFFFVLWRLPNERLSIIQKSVITGTVIGYFIHNMFVFDNVVSYILFFALVGFVHSEAIASRNDVPSTATQQKYSLPYLVPAAIALIALPFILYFVVYEPYKANASLLEALQINNSLTLAPMEAEKNVAQMLMLFEKALSLNTQGKQEIREQMSSVAAGVYSGLGENSQIAETFVKRAAEELQKQIAEAPMDPRAHYLLQVLHMRVGDYAAAFENNQAARALSPQKQMFGYDHVIILLNTNQYEEAMRVAREVYELDTTNEHAKRLYATTAVYAGKMDVFNALVTESPSITDDMNVIRGLILQKQFARVIPILESKLEVAKRSQQFPGDSIILLAVAYYEAGNKKAASTTLAEARAVGLQLEEQQYVAQVEFYQSLVARNVPSLLNPNR